MAEYLVEIPHAPEECPPQLAASRWTTYIGCESGTHTTWTIADVPSPEEAWELVPRLLRDTARVVAVQRSRERSGT